jgi:protein O-mannosyl-transferase
MLKSLSDVKAIHIIVILGLIVFANCFFNGFVWDDKAFIINNPDIHTFNPFALFGPNLFNSGSFYRPIPAIYFSFLYLLSGNSSFLYHFVQVMLHIVNVILLYYVFKSFFKSTLALILSLFFLVHPMQVESVSFIAASISVLVFLFGMSAFLISKKTDLSNRSLAFIFLLILCALFTKESGFLFVIIICVYRVLFHKKLRPLIFVLAGTIPLYLAIRFGIGHVYLASENLAPISRVVLSDRLQTIPEILFYYLSTFFFPVHLLVEQHWVVTSIGLDTFYIPLFMDVLFISLSLYFGYRLINRNKTLVKIYLFFALWFVLGIGMHLQIFPLDMTVADRWFYFPMVGLIGMFGALITAINNKKIKNILLVILLIYIACLSIRTMMRNGDWRDPITLYMHDSKREENFSIENNLGAELGTVGRYDEASARLRKSIALFPYETNYANIAVTYEKMGNDEEALVNYKNALESKAYNVGNHTHALLTYIGYVELLFKQKKYEDAIRICREGLLDYPDDYRLWSYMAYAEYKLGNNNKAIDAATNAYQLSPNQVTTEIYNRIISNSPLNINFVGE